MPSAVGENGLKLRTNDALPIAAIRRVSDEPLFGVVEHAASAPVAPTASATDSTNARQKRRERVGFIACLSSLNGNVLLYRADSRITVGQLTTTVSRGPSSPASIFIRSSAPIRPISRNGREIVVSAGRRKFEMISWLSNPTTAISPGMLRPASRMASYAPIASRSLAQKMPSGAGDCARRRLAAR